MEYRSTNSNGSGKAASRNGTAEQPQGLQKLTEDLNKQGKKLLELKATLYKEASIHQNEFDMRIFVPLVIKYQNDIGMADSMRAIMIDSDSAYELESLISKKQRYHYYLEQLQTSFIKTETVSCFGVHDKPSCTHTADDKNRKGIFKDGTIATGPDDIAQAAVDVAGIRNGKIDGDPNIHDKMAQDKEVCEMTNNSMKLKQDNRSSGGDKDSREITAFNSKFLATSDKDLFIELSEEEAEVSDSEKYKVLRKRLRNRTLLCHDHFSDPLPPVLANFQSTPSSIVKHSVNEGQWDLTPKDLELVEPDKDAQWTNKSKSANESWYEFKERCSVTSLSEHIMQKGEPQKSASPFYIKDYMKTPSSSSAVASSEAAKCVRFSLSPRQRVVCPSKTQNEYSLDSSSSDDDEVGFVQQFPCVEKPDRTSGRARRQLNFYY